MQDIPSTHPARLMPRGLLFLGRAGNLAQRLDALKAVAAARLPSLQDIDPAAPGYCPGLSRRVQATAKAEPHP